MRRQDGAEIDRIDLRLRLHVNVGLEFCLALADTLQSKRGQPRMRLGGRRACRERPHANQETSYCQLHRVRAPRKRGHNLFLTAHIFFGSPSSWSNSNGYVCS